MLQGDLYEQDYESDSEEEMEDNYLQGFTSIVVHIVWWNDSHNPRNPDPAAVQSHRECSLPFEKACHTCGRFVHPSVRCDFLEKYANILGYWKTKDPVKVKAVQDRWLDQKGDRRTPRKVAMTYCQDAGFDVNKLADEMDWDFFNGVEYDSSGVRVSLFPLHSSYSGIKTPISYHNPFP